MHQETFHTQPTSDDAIEDLLESVHEAIDMTYALSERSRMPELAPSLDREEADRRQYDMREAMYYPNPEALPLRKVRDIMVAERERRRASALAAPSAPYNGVTPGFTQRNDDKLRDIGWL